MLVDALAPVTPERLAARLRTRWVGRAYEWLGQCASTNDLAAARAREGAPAGLVIAADEQTAGRGRLGRTWLSGPGENLMFSIVLRSGRPPAEIPPITLLVGAAVADALRPLGVAPRLKWPNDVQLVDGQGARRKLAGILTEMTSAGERIEHVVVGVGINVNVLDFPPEIADRATSLRRALGKAVDRASLLADVLGALEPRLEDFERRGAEAAAEAFAQHAPLPERCRLGVPGRPGETIEGTALGVDASGALQLRDDAGRIHRIVSGELL